LTLHSVCEITPISDSDSIARTISFSAAGNTSTTRSIVFRRARGVQRAEHEVPGFGGGQREADRFQVAQLADQDRVRVLAQRRAQRVVEAQRVRADLALVDQALLGFVHELDRVFDRQHVAELVLVEVVDHRRERGRLARARRPGHQHETTGFERQLGEDLGRVELLECEDLRWNGPEHGACAAVLG